MPLCSGDKLGPYEIVSPIGAGGMGEVYRGRDSRLGRDVALKILPPQVADDPMRRQRFELEARAVAALNHPNIVAIYDVGEGYIVSELVDGEPLRGGKLDLRKTIEIAVQIASGLAAAHDAGIVHRDLKPDNILLTRDGRPKILDFGLAKVQSKSAADDETVTVRTKAGVVMGTAGYMSPEQVRGAASDHRSDIFSFGVILHELLTGKRVFHGETSAETMTAILKQDAPELPETVPAGVRQIVAHCLGKKPIDRFQSARDLMFALGSLTDTATPGHTLVALARPRKWAVAAVVALAVTLVAGGAYWLARRPASLEAAEFAITVPGEVNHLALSVDGKWLAFVSPGESGGAPMVYVQRVGSSEAHAITGSSGASYPFWSPDDAYVAFFANGKLRKAATSGGSPQNLGTVGAAPRGGSWGSTGVILYARDSGGGLWRVNADGSGAAPATKRLSAATASHRWPFFLPDGDHFLMFSGTFTVVEDRADGIYLSSLSKPEKMTQLLQNRSSGAFSGGRVYYVDNNGALAASTVDIAAGKLTGAPQVVAAKVAWSPSTYYALFALSENSTVVYSGSSLANRSQLTWFDAAGKELSRVGPVSVVANPAISPDGRRVAFDSTDYKANNVDLWIFNLQRNSSARFTFDPKEETNPVWSRDGGTIAYRLPSNPGTQIRLKKADGQAPDKGLPPLDDAAVDLVPNSWAPGNRDILCTLQEEKGTSALVLQSVDGGKPRAFLAGAPSQTNGQISPDGKWVAYASNETGDWEIYVTTFPAAQGKWQVSRGGGAEPRWRGDSQAIFYIGPGQMLTEILVTTDGSFSTAAPRNLFSIRGRAPISDSDRFTYDVAPDGKRFLVNQYVKPEQPAPLTILLHAGSPPAK